MHFIKPLRMSMLCVAMLFIAISCDKTSNSPELEAITIQTATIDGYTVELLSDQALVTGYNQLYWRVTSGGELVDIQSFTIAPSMTMTMMGHSHATPFNQPTETAEYDKVFSNMAVFIMPSGDMGYWEIDFDIQTATDQTISGSMEIEVASSWRLTSVKSTDGSTTYFVTWYAPQEPATGNQELSFMVHKRVSMMSFPAVTNAEVSVYPYMDMGGGEGHSTPFQNPEPMGEGMYTGSINYSMSGTWTTDITLLIDGDSLAVPTFEYNVQAR